MVNAPPCWRSIAHSFVLHRLLVSWSGSWDGGRSGKEKNAVGLYSNEALTLQLVLHHCEVICGMTGEESLNGTRKARKSYEQIIAHVRGEISSGELRPGDRLPPETDLARSLGVSRPTVREALKVLEALNVLESSTGPTGGTFVKSLDDVGVAEYLTDSITLLLDTDELTLEELWSAREAIEILSVGMAAARRTEQDLSMMRRIIESDEDKDFEAYFPDITFHRAIASASKNRLLSLFMLSIRMTISTLAERYVLPEAKQVSQDQHRLIYEAILDQDEALAQMRMKEHLQMAYEVYRQAVPRTMGDRITSQTRT
jgi:GntR family transcriptional regulator, transcriptional repressor for pyruvate dehydrogenase complex